MDVNYYIINNKLNQSKKGNIMASFAYIKELFEKNGFITIDVLRQILEQNGLTI